MLAPRFKKKKKNFCQKLRPPFLAQQPRLHSIFAEKRIHPPKKTHTRTNTHIYETKVIINPTLVRHKDTIYCTASHFDEKERVFGEKRFPPLRRRCGAPRRPGVQLLPDGEAAPTASVPLRGRATLPVVLSYAAGYKKKEKKRTDRKI